MSKQMLSTILLFAIGIGFAIATFVMFTTGADIVQVILYAIPAVAAFGAIIMLPFRKTS